MSIDLTGIANKNEFFTQRYLATYFEDVVKEKAKAWKDAAKDGAAPNPAAELGRLRQTYQRARVSFDEAASEARRCELTAENAARVLAALGFPEAALPQVAYESGESAAVWREFLAADGTPQVWVALAFEAKSSDEGVFAAQPLNPTNLAPAMATADEDALESLVDALFFRTPEPARFVLVLTMGHILLCDRNKWAEKRCLDIDLPPRC